MRIDGITNTTFQAKIILAEKNNALIKKSIESSFNHEHLKCKPQLYAEKDDGNRAIWAATMFRNCNK